MKKILLFILTITVIFNFNLISQVAISADGSSPNGSAMLEVKSTDKGLLIPCMIETQRNSIASPATGLMVYQTDNINGFYYYDGSSWRSIGAGVISIDDLSDCKSDGSSVFLGLNTGSNDDGSNNNVGIGIDALFNNSSGQHNTAIGVSALYLNTYGSGNSAMGSSALHTNTGGTNNASFGYNSLRSNTFGNSNVAVGHESMFNNTTGTKNTSLGGLAMRSNILGNNNTVMGYMANFHNQNGSNNTILGYEAGRGTASHDKSGNVFLGYQAGYGETGSDKLYIENSSSFLPLIYGEFNSDLLRVNGTLHIKNAYQFPVSDGTQDQVLTTNGSGLVSWQTDIDEFSDGGEAVGTDRSLGNTDNYAMIFKTNNAERLKIFNDGGIRFDGHVGIFTDPEPISSINKSINLYAAGIYSNPHLKISGHNSSYIDLVSRRIDVTSGKSWRIGSGSVSTADLDRFYIYNPDDGYCFMIRDGGNIGIGNESPDEKLHIKGSDIVKSVIETTTNTSSGSASYRMVRPSSAAWATFDFAHGATTNNQWGLGLKAGLTGLSFWDATQSDVIRLYLEQTTGNIGMGTTTPDTKLDINGVVTIQEVASTPANPDSDGETRIYIKDSKYIIQFNDGGTIKYRYIDLTSTDANWAYSTTEP